jgi:hypothetical protein
MWVECSDPAKLHEGRAIHGVSGVFLRQTSFLFGSKLFKSVFNVGVTRN